MFHQNRSRLAGRKRPGQTARKSTIRWFVRPRAAPEHDYDRSSPAQTQHAKPLSLCGGYGSRSERSIVAADLEGGYEIIDPVMVTSMSASAQT
jgi:hypothetical protein